MSTDAASPRPRNSRRGGNHLTLVTDDMPTLTLTVGDVPVPATPAAGRHAAPRTLPVTGSVTMRALLALGALATILGLCTGRAEAMYGAPDKSHDPAEADPDLDPEQPVKVDGLTTTTDVPKTRTSAGSWAPTVEPVQVHTFTITPADSATGRHRKPAATEGWGAWNPDTWGRPAGRHRKPNTPAAGHGYAGGGRHHHGHDRDRDQQGHHHGRSRHANAAASGALIAV
ncbi:hypothetical protein [Streptomyces sp. NPDC056683]|uniref:hypothetical protein n=1 Tax=Streptomyces sp. NPDC056683 TaxID=3345910 RepID=UPI003690D772